MSVVALLALAALVAAGLTLIVAAILRKLTTNLKVVHIVSGFAVPIIVFGSAALFPIRTDTLERWRSLSRRF